MNVWRDSPPELGAEGAKRSLLIGTVVFEQTAPALATRGHPRLTQAGNGVYCLVSNAPHPLLSKDGGGLFQERAKRTFLKSNKTNSTLAH